ncbi:MAG TPA: hypothetical protein VFG72_00545 [Marmoricola sp.]|nr:hypothetical protein [Marmoricola sp.]
MANVPGDRRRRRTKYVLLSDDELQDVLVAHIDTYYRRLRGAAQWTGEVAMAVPVRPTEKGAPVRRGLFRSRRKEVAPTLTRTLQVPASLPMAWEIITATPERLAQAPTCPHVLTFADTLVGAARDFLLDVGELDQADVSGHGAVRQLLQMAAELDALRLLAEAGQLPPCKGNPVCIAPAPLEIPPGGGRRASDSDVELVASVLDRFGR